MNGEKFFAFNPDINDKNIIQIFAMEDGQEDLINFLNWAADGTFKISPSIYH